MSFKTVLVHLDHQVQAKHLLKAAVRLAAQHQAHLIGTYIMHPIEPYVGTTVDISIAAEVGQLLSKEQHERAFELARLFETATKGQDFVAEWRFLKNNQRAVATTLVELGRAADIILVSGEINDPPSGVTNPGIASVVMSSSRPALLVPEAYTDKSLGEFVLVAWDGSRESSRAVFDSLPLLKSASTVWLHRINSNDESKNHGDDLTKDLADTLSRHGVDLELSFSQCNARKVGEELLTVAGDRGADCMVMGAYGHSRMHSLLLGGATRYVLQNATIPLFLSH